MRKEADLITVNLHLHPFRDFNLCTLGRCMLVVNHG